MLSKKTYTKISFPARRSEQGYSLIELMITVALTAVIMVAVYAAYTVQSKTHVTQREIARLQQDIRGALFMMEYDLMNAGRDPFQSNQYGLTDIRYYGAAQGAEDNLMGPPPVQLPPFNSFPVLEFSSLRLDSDGDGRGDQNLTIRYQVYDYKNDGRFDLGRRLGNGGGPLGPVALDPPISLVAEGVVAVGYAFAFDDSPDGTYKLNRTPPPAAAPPGSLGTVIWAVDSDGDGDLDTNIDTDGDGEITVLDDNNNDGIINELDAGGFKLVPEVPITFARAARIMVLVQSERPSQENVIDCNQYVVGNRVLPPPNAVPFPGCNGFGDRFKRRAESVVVAFRNFQKS
jgi:prepilin-type N-terminal cleavage/methylation domain-containing protein